MTTKECLHRFCSECIITALRSGNKECPTCRKKLVSKRSLRPDPNFDLLISKIYPSRDEYEAIQERVLAKVNQSHSQQALVNSITEGIKSQSQNRPQRSRKGHEEGGTGGGHREHRDSGNSTNSNLTNNTNNGTQNGDANREGSSQGTDRQGSNPPSVRSTPSPSPSNTSSFSKVKRSKSVLTSERSEDSESNSEMESRAEGESNIDTDAESSEYGLDEIEMVFKPHPTEMSPDNPLLKVQKENSVRYLKTTANATVDHLSKYLAMRLTLEKPPHPEDYRMSFLIYIAPAPNQFVLLTGGQSLSQIQEKYWKINKPLELFYTWKMS